MRLLFLLLMFSATTLYVHGQASDKKSKQKKDTYTILIAGYPSKDQYQYEKVAPKYHFNLIWIGGCMIEQEISDSIYRHNKVVDFVLDSINGAGWRDRYEAEVKATYSRDSLLIGKLKSEKFITDLLKEQKKHGNGLEFYVDSTLSNDTYRVNVKGYINDGKGTRGSYYRVIMRYSDLTIIRMDKKLIIR